MSSRNQNRAAIRIGQPPCCLDFRCRIPRNRFRTLRCGKSIPQLILENRSTALVKLAMV